MSATHRKAITRGHPFSRGPYVLLDSMGDTIREWDSLHAAIADVRDSLDFAEIKIIWDESSRDEGRLHDFWEVCGGVEGVFSSINGVETVGPDIPGMSLWGIPQGWCAVGWENLTEGRVFA